MRGGLVARFFLFFTFFTFRFDISFFSFSISFFSSMFLVARRVIIFALLESARARRGAAWRRETRRLKDWNFVRFKQPYLLQISTTQSMLLDPCDMENQYLSRWRAEQAAPRCFLECNTSTTHLCPQSNVHTARDSCGGLTLSRARACAGGAAAGAAELSKHPRSKSGAASAGVSSAPRSRQRAQDFKRARRGSS